MFSNESKDTGFFRIWVESQNKTKIIFKTLNLVKLNNVNEISKDLIKKPAEKLNV